MNDFGEVPNISLNYEFGQFQTNSVSFEPIQSVSKKFEFKSLASPNISSQILFQTLNLSEFIRTGPPQRSLIEFHQVPTRSDNYIFPPHSIRSACWTNNLFGPISRDLQIHNIQNKWNQIRNENNNNKNINIIWIRQSPQPDTASTHAPC